MTHRTKEDWDKIVEGRTLHQLSQFITADLIGYRVASVHRTDDERSLENLFKALLEFRQKSGGDS